MTKDFAQFEQGIGFTFKNEGLLRQAFTHRSYLNEHRDEEAEHNERLEFLGDAVLELIVTHFLYEKFPERPEGDLTAFRAALVNAVTLSEVASEIGMNDYLLLSRGEAKDTGRARGILLANAIEALIGAIYLDQGYEAAEMFIEKFLFPKMDEIMKKKLWRDPKSTLQEKAQEAEGATPYYAVVRETGPDHDKQFIVGVYVKDMLLAQGGGKSKQEAEQDAARNALEEKGW
ncbi:ribonuclease III [Candidatus Adlerbacteria bacterium RIFCSPHIGHO2_12_FULL_53_18]|uniref:Ribonuclease 3 n=1 Tax=Candidatus Adlerbacteria bacterium RIFCSPHIGHO2_12_FULL_53_18 TaxID=1797242 RepID=A0A1F4XS76_9BACT|nr:MAG: ribonuclease III [Candidatus Adlerbacteria bacterium RIFCSPHIGHO2_12_FULL_53_18]